MSLATQTTSLLDDLSRLTAQQWVLRLVAVPATVAFLVIAGLAGGRLAPALVVAVMLLCAVVVLAPDSGAALGLLMVLLGSWLLRVPEQLGAWTVLAAVDLVLLHLAVALASYGPPATVLEPAMLRVWTRRAVLLAGAAVAGWLAARLVAGLGLPRSAAAMATGLAVLLAWAGVLALRLAVSRPE